MNPVSFAFETYIRAHEKVHIAFCVVGIVGCLMLYGVLQERIMQHPFGEGEDEEYFKYTLLLVFCNRIVTCAVAFFSLISQGETLKPVCPVYNYAAVSVSNVIATTCQYEALKYVSFPVQTLCKCAKMIPVMIWGTFILFKKYNVIDYAIAVVITIGCTLFLLMGDVKSKTAKDSFDASLYGVLLMLGYLGFDGFTSTFQDKLFKGYKMNIYNQILYVTACSATFSLFGLISAQQLIPAINFVLKHPDALSQIMILSAAATTGQLFISHTIKNFGALLFATVMTTRQFLSILLSCILFAHPLSLGQWVGTFLVFGSLYYKTYAKKPSKKEAPKEVEAPKEGTAVDEESQPLKNFLNQNGGK
eukprot:TRINITY_DN2750_c0_g1_i4.p1 TRINITY_DN2750_c0_g1~~TRINITY_DN2750_c0_g1_i4.p1  ORF type:complete len:361 (-),score=45.97 TRINITY_DN2750_c0_g1_i4:872-1954(-)